MFTCEIKNTGQPIYIHNFSPKKMKGSSCQPRYSQYQTLILEDAESISEHPHWEEHEECKTTQKVQQTQVVQPCVC